MLDFKNLLNKKQLEAVMKLDGTLLVLSAAGSGKTRVITYRIANLLEKGIPAENILAVTFTNKAAKEMKDRVNKITNNANGVWISTFHSMCANILREEAVNIGLNKNFNICDSQDQKSIVKECLDKLGLDDKKYEKANIVSVISRAKDNLLSPEDYKLQILKEGKNLIIADIYEMYQKILESSQNLDFGDLQFKFVKALQNNKFIFEKYREKFQYIMVDEFQDTNDAQYLMIKLLSSKYKNLCVVGDDDQSIYSWRGANNRNILDFEKDYPGAVSIKLEQNYRSTKKILKAADTLIKKNLNRKEKTIFTNNEEGEDIKTKNLLTDKEEANFIAKEIKSLQTNGFNLSDIAIFYRTNAQSRLFEEVFKIYQIPYILVGSIKFYDRKEIKDIISYLKVIVSPNDFINLKRIINIPRRGMSDRIVDIIESLMTEGDTFFDIMSNIVSSVYSEQIFPPRQKLAVENFYKMMLDFFSKQNTLSLTEMINYVIEKTKYMEFLEQDNTIYKEGRIENIKEFVSSASDYEETSGDTTLEGFLEHIALVNDAENFKDSMDKVTLMTLHLAKGLEYPVVFLTGMEEGLFPNPKVDYSKEDLEEERRLCFVGITRAMKKLFITYATNRRIYGILKMHSPSRFLIDANIIENALEEPIVNPYARFDDFINNFDNDNDNDNKNLSFSKDLNSSFVHQNNNFDNDNSQFKLGDKVLHPMFGKGTILDIFGKDDKMTAVVKFYSGSEKKLLLKYAKLTHF